MTNYRSGGDRYGRHRVISPEGALPQAATKVDNSLPIYDNEILIDVRTLNIDSASFRQMLASGEGHDGVARQVIENVEKMGKQMNPVTGSGGMLLGKVSQMGPKYSNPVGLKEGDDVCTLVSLTLTPLRIDRIVGVKDSEQIDIEGKAILFDSGVLARIPPAIDLGVCLALLDVAGAAPQADRLVKPGDTVCIIGTGKAGILCAAAIRQKLGGDCKLIATDFSKSNAEIFKGLGMADEVFVADALRPTEILDGVASLTGGKMCDLIINTANVEGTELSSVLACKQGGKIYFFNMATSFQKAALGAEGVGMDVDMIIGNGYAPGHVDFTIDVYRQNAAVKTWFDKRFA